ncbi:hypothetical protein GCM10009789_62030 [Kribbella sancticallisti]|uniref:Uncharacterized protein n=1 Tax=Kribbella sancticallisti TaxID=460087 RepID=A0ABP4Q6V8_9ACTN
MGVSAGGKGRSGAPTPAVVGIGRSMRARDVSRPHPADRPAREKKKDQEEGSGGSSPVSS